jgi:hypothetical protein
MHAFTSFLEGLHESRRRQAERELRRYAHLIAAAERDPRPAITVVHVAEDVPRLEGTMSAAGVRA